MNADDLNFLREETKIITPVRIPSPLKTSSQFHFVAVAADMDKPDKTHIYEGEIRVGQIEELTDEERFASLEEVFGKKAWEIAESQIPVRFFKGKLSIQGTQGGTHCKISGTPEEVIDKVVSYPTNQKRLIIRTLEEGWDIGLITQVMDTIHKAVQAET